MELTCDRCGATYNDEADIKMAKNMEQKFAENCEKHGVEKRGIAPCPNIPCKGQLVEA